MLDVGASAYYGEGITNESGPTLVPGGGGNTRKTRWGGDLEFYPMNNLTIKGEYISGRGVDATSTSTAQPTLSSTGYLGVNYASPNTFNLNQEVSGYWAQIAYNFLPTYTGVVKYEFLTTDPLAPIYGHRGAWNLGIMKWLDDRSQVKFFYEINTEQFDSFNNNMGVFEWICSY